MDRRKFLKLSVATAMVAATGGLGWAADKQPDIIPRRKLGRTGEMVSMVGLGGFHLGLPSEDTSIRIVRTAIDNGMNFLDNCWDYNDGASEIRMGRALRDGYRDRAFLMTKIDGRDKLTAQKQIDESLRRLQTDHLDLLQLHEVIGLTQVFLAGVLLGTRADQTVKTHEPLDGADTHRQGKLPFQALGTEAGLTTQAHHHPHDAG